MKNTRRIVLKALLRVDQNGAYSNLVLDEALSDPELDGRDKAFISNIFYGVLERRITLDYIIRSFSSVRLKKIEPTVLEILRLSVYQLVFMDKVPDSAAVNEAVTLCKKEKLYRSSGFVNGVLRSITRAENRFPLPDESDAVKYLSVKYSCPEDIVSLWLEDYGRDVTEGTLSALAGRPPIFVRVNTIRTTEEKLIEKLKLEGICAEKTKLKNALEIKLTGSVTSLESYAQGLFHVQDLSSQVCCELLGVCDGDTVSDVCAAPGGKAFTAAQCTPLGRVYSYDIYDHKIKLIEASLRRLGITNVSARIRDAAGDTPLETSDKIICDVPCSGLGVLRRKPEIRYKSDTGAETLPELQLKILENSAKFLRPGGTLIYSTCTLNRKENNINAALFLERNKDFEPLELALPDGVMRTINEAENCLTLFPQTNGTDGFFVAVFRKKA